MAQKVQVILVDDLDGGDADETVLFGLDGVSYEIDLSADNSSKLRETLAGYVGQARRVGTRAGRKRRARATAASNGSAGRSGSAKEIREWARSNGYTVSERGRVSGEIVAAYESAH